ncbi:MAG TPA: biopolymer transporter ExbD [Verrucomicrobiae bacterium]|jgi:biopolymer transport protein ExbD|nr:biopolymer transporter ExbD [Verrucomicrobiae bacterium]
MKKCSHTAHHTLTELNITPLLDLAFVLLVIFIITTTPIVNDMEPNLPKASKHEKDPPKDAYYITIDANGTIWMQKAVVELANVQSTLASLRVDNPDLGVIIRGDSKTKYGRIRAVLDACQSANVVKVELATEPGTK